METFIAAAALFCAVWLVIAVVRAEDTTPIYGDVPKRLPDPGPRDQHTVTGTLFRAKVPRWT